MKFSTPRALTAALAAAAVVGGVLPATAFAAPGSGAVLTSANVSPNVASNTNQSVLVTVTGSTHSQVTAGTPPVIMFIEGPPTAPGIDPSSSPAGPFPNQQYFATNVTVSGSTVSGRFNLAPGNLPASPSAYDLTICYATSSTDTSCADADPSLYDFGSGIFQVISPTPALSTIAPASRAAGGTAQETVTGLNIARGGTLNVLRDGQPTTGFTFSGYNYSGGGTVSAALSIDPSVTARSYDIQYTNTDGKTDMLSNALTVTPAIALAVNPITPSGVTKGVQAYPFQITGSNFQPHVAVTAVDPAQTGAARTAGVTFTVTSVTPTAIAGTVKVDSTATPTSTTAPVTRNLVVTNTDDGSSASLTNGFTLFPLPTVTSVSPNPRGRGWKGDLTVTGTNFRLVGSTGVPLVDLGANITHGVVDYTSSTSLIVRNVVIDSAAATGGRIVRVSNADGDYVNSPANTMTVNVAPVPSSISPSHGARGGPVTLTVQGSGLGTAPNSITISVVDPATGTAVCTSPAATPTSGGSVSADCSLPGSINTGQYSVRLTNVNDGGTASCAGVCFTVDAFGVTGVSPSFGFANNEPRAVPVTVTGTNFPSDSHISFRHNPTLFDQPDITAVPCPTGGNCGVSSDGTSIKEYFVFNNVAPGAYDVLVTGTVTGNPATGQCSCQITVTAAASPVVSTVTPSSVVQGATQQLITVTGTGFYKGDRAQISGGDGKLVPVPGSEVISADHLSMTFKVNVDPAAASPGSNVLKIVDSASPPNTSGTSPITVTKRPTITSLTPAAIGRGGVTPAGGFSVKGQNFVADADPNKATKVTFCTGVTATGLTITKGASGADDTAAMTLSVASDAPLGNCTVTVTNPDGGVGTSPLTITDAPVVTKSTPSGLTKGHAAIDLVLNGTGFVTGATVAFLYNGTVDPKITVNSTHFDSAGQLTVNVTTAADAPTGPRSIKVTNTDLGTSTCSTCFAIAVVPTAPLTVRARVGDGRVQVTWTKPFSDGGAPISSYVITVNPGGRQVAVPSGSATSATVNALTNGTAYTFAVKATNVVGSGPDGVADPATPAPISRMVSITPEQLVNTNIGLGVPGGAPGKLANTSFDVPFLTAPTAANGAAVSVTVASATAATYVKVYGTGTTSTGGVFYGLPGFAHTGTAFVNFGSSKSMHVSVVGGPAHIIINQMGWLERLDQDGAPASSVGGRFVPADRVLINYRMSSAGPLPQANLTHFYDFNGSLPDVDAIALQISTSNSYSNGSVTAYSPADGPLATSENFTHNRSGSTFVVARVSKVPTPDPTDDPSVMTNRIYFKVSGQTGLLVSMVGYWGKDVSAFAGHSVTVKQQRLLSATTPVGGEISIKVPASVPGSTTGVLISITAWDSTGATVVRTYPDLGTVPTSYAIAYVRGDKVTNLSIVGVGDNRYIKLKVYGASTKLFVDLLGYVN